MGGDLVHTDGKTGGNDMLKSTPPAWAGTGSAAKRRAAIEA